MGSSGAVLAAGTPASGSGHNPLLIVAVIVVFVVVIAVVALGVFRKR
jgi:Ni,Fe-hydrogenase I cytochrome b subunit